MYVTSPLESVCWTIASTFIYSRIMLKRGCPFGDSISNQMKTHVGQKEVAEGVDKEKHMKEVYERTLAMMFEAQKQAGKSDSAVATNGHQPDNRSTQTKGAGSCRESGSCAPHMELLPGQCFLDEHGQIIAGQTASKSNEDGAQPPRGCACQTSTVSVPVSRCSTCQDPVCPACLRICLQCESRFCNMCSVINYEEDCDRIFCLSCSSHME